MFFQMLHAPHLLQFRFLHGQVEEGEHVLLLLFKLQARPAPVRSWTELHSCLACRVCPHLALSACPSLSAAFCLDDQAQHILLSRLRGVAEVQVVFDSVVYLQRAFAVMFSAALRVSCTPRGLGAGFVVQLLVCLPPAERPMMRARLTLLLCRHSQLLQPS
jgi:hypothetical protein